MLPRRMTPCLFAVLVAILGGARAHAQASQQSSSSETGPSVSGSRVGYIDSAIPTAQFRLRYDAGYNFNRPNRAEFFYAKPRPFGPGLPDPERSIDYQDLSAYLEVPLSERCSAFVEAPWRFLNPDLNPNANGVGDLIAGFKYAFLFDTDRVASFQLKTYVPTGAASRGLGTDHVSIEPGLLWYERLTDKLTFEGEFRTWIPIGGTDFAAPLLRYGVGLHYDLIDSCNFKLAPVTEIVGWTVLGGHATAFVSPTTVLTEGSSGDTIVNVKLGVRLNFGGPGEWYVGYGRALTGDRWYEDIYRVEFRLAF